MNFKSKQLIYFILLITLLIVNIFIAADSGSIKTNFYELITGIFSKDNLAVNAIIDVRFPRIIISILVGAALATSGLLLQTVLKNPLIDPSIVGVSSGSNLFLYIALGLFPHYNNLKSLFSIIGGMIGFIIIYSIAYKTKSNIKIILIGIAVSSFFSGILQLIQYFRIGDANTTSNLVTSNTAFGMKSWEDVNLLLTWIPLFLIISFLFSKICNLFILHDSVLSSLGINIIKNRLIISILAVILASIATSVAGVIVFLALIIPHISKLLIGKNHVYTIPFCALLGAFILLLFDTAGRLLFSPIEIPADILMMIIGGPIFIILIKKGVKYE